GTAAGFPGPAASGRRARRSSSVAPRRGRVGPRGPEDGSRAADDPRNEPGEVHGVVEREGEGDGRKEEQVAPPDRERESPRGQGIQDERRQYEGEPEKGGSGA